ncbi:MAG: hypothetical protein IT184_09130 [Acidobacteria bacterium]|nr:hypothetical protein [Acidobacteriota bacterium]
MPQSTYSPKLRTGVVLCGSGTAGAYHAGVLQALTEAGIKIDVVAAHGAGVMTALAAAIDGGPRVWGPDSVWASPRLARAYRWRRSLRIAAWGGAAVVLLLASPLLMLAAAAVVYALSFLAALVNLVDVSARLVALYGTLVQSLFTPPILPTMLPRALVLAVGAIVAVLAFAAIRAAREERSPRRRRGTFWWHLVGAPLDAAEPGATMVETLWTLVRGASHEPRPAAADIGRRYVEILSDNFGQPGFHEVLVGAHDLDSRRDLVGAVLAAPARGAFEGRRRGAPREAEILDFTGPQRELLVGVLQGALRLPVATLPAPVQFASDSYWRGERHHLCDRPELAVRLVEELAAIGVEQVVIVAAAPAPAGPHAMRARRADLRGRLGEVLRSLETAALSDAVAFAAGRFSGVFVVRPDHNPIGPFDFGAVYDEASDRQRTIGELTAQGYADAYRTFIEPTVAAGERFSLEELTQRA